MKMKKKYPLAIYAPYIGAPSETFIEKHMKQLLPDQTAVIADKNSKPWGGYWTVNCPQLILSNIKPLTSLQKMRKYAYARILNKNCDIKKLAIEKFLREYNICVMMGEYLHLALPYMEISKKLGIKYFAHAHGFDVSIQLKNPMYRNLYKLYNQSDGIITVSEYSKKRLIEIGIKEHKIHVIPCSVDIPSSFTARHKKQIVHIIAVGRMTPKKAPIVLLDSFRRAAEICNNIHLDYIGDGQLMAACKQFIRTFKLDERIRLYGSLPNNQVLKMLRNSDVFLQHSVTDPDTGDQEGLPVGILEAMANGLPVISTMHAGIPEAVIDNVTGLLSEEFDSIKMSTNIMRLAGDYQKRIAMGESGYERAKKHFAWNLERSNLLKLMRLA